MGLQVLSKKSSTRPVGCLQDIGFIGMISETNFHGRGNPQNRPGEFMMLAKPGFTYCISVVIGGHAFIWGYSRMLQIDPWGLCVTNAFRRCSAPNLSNSWAECFAPMAWLYRPTVIQLIREQPWMVTVR